MNKRILSLIAVVFLAGCGTPDGMYLTSDAFKDGKDIPKEYTCDGANVSPPLTINQAPKETVRFALVMHDPDAPSDWVHWLMWNIPKKDGGLAQGAVPEGAKQGNNDFGLPIYGGPCPPEGEEHTYVFDLYALDTSLVLDSATTKDELISLMGSHILEQATLTGTYKRK